jgi:hypothetical protein
MVRSRNNHKDTLTDYVSIESMANEGYSVA